jgi:hypothetical protein
MSNFFKDILRPIIRSSVRWNGTSLISASTGSRIFCKKIIGPYKIYIDKIWNGNGFGSTSNIYVVDTRTGEIREPNSRMFDEYTYIVKRLQDSN